MQKSKRVRSCLEISTPGSRSSRDRPEATVSDIIDEKFVIGTFQSVDEEFKKRKKLEKNC
jgi:hypothetical protein